VTKDGRPSPIKDIRLFEARTSTYLDGQEEAVAYARRMAWFLNGAGFSLGSFPALYVRFASSLNPGAARAASDHGDWWHRYIDVGAADDFPNGPDAPDTIMSGVVAALSVFRPDQMDMINRADAIVRAQRQHLRFLMKRRENNKVVTEISFNIAQWPDASCLFITVTDKATGGCREADPIALGWYMEAFDLLGGIRLKDAKNLREKPERPVFSGIVSRRG